MASSYFSRRTAWDTAASPLAEALAEAQAAGSRVLDLAQSNPTRCGFHYDEDAILGALGDRRSLRYEPDPRGLLHAREAVAQYYAEAGAAVRTDQILLTTSTSEAYSFLFRLLCDAGDEVLVAQPGYPLFEYLAGLDDIVLRHYPLFYDFGWWIDFAGLEERITPRTRAILLVHPNNPTGHFTPAAERARLVALCARRGLALVVDEVFLDYRLGAPAGDADSFARISEAALLFVVSGLSKVAALPQMKVGWLAATGSPELVHAAMDRLEVIADTFLSMNAPAQLALPVWLGSRAGIVDEITGRVTHNLAQWKAAGFDPLPVQAGWNAVLRLPRWIDITPERIVRETGVIVHAGDFYGFAGPGWIVTSLIVDSAICAEGIGRLRAWVDLQHPER